MVWIKPVGAIAALCVLIFCVTDFLPQPEVHIQNVLSDPRDQTPVPQTLSIPSQTKKSTQLERMNLATFRGATPDGKLQAMNGHLLVNTDLKRWIDFYLSAIGEVYLTDIVAFMEAEMRTLPAPADAEALDLLHRYLAYREESGLYDEVTARRTERSGVDEIIARTEWLQKLRRLHFNRAEIHAFFAMDEDLDKFTIARLQLAQQGAEPEQLQALENDLPQRLQIYREQAETLSRLRAINESVEDSDNLRQKRAEAFGNEAAKRLEQLDEQRRAWYSRLHRYRDFIDETSGAPDADTLHQDYLNTHFSEQERVRVSAALKRLEPQVQPSLTPLAASAEEG